MARRGTLPPRDMTGQRRFVAPASPRKHRVKLRADHPAVVEGRTIMPTRVFHASAVKRVLKSGVNSKKLGSTVTKGRWRGFPLYMLTLEERRTCPRSCQQWRTCFGSNMQWAQRIENDEDFEVHLWLELKALQAEHPGGFAVRLHILGDFYSVEYARLWEVALDEFPALHIFGFTARPVDGAIGAALYRLATTRWDRFAMRFSGARMPRMASLVVDRRQDATSVVCPAQNPATPERCCANCALCWQSDANITFLRH